MTTSIEKDAEQKYNNAIDAALLAGADMEDIQKIGDPYGVKVREGEQYSVIPAPENFEEDSSPLIPHTLEEGDAPSDTTARRLAHLSASSKIGTQVNYDLAFAADARAVETGQEELLRLEAKDMQNARAAKELVDLVTEMPEETSLIVSTAALVNSRIAQEDRYALEKEAVDKLNEFAEENRAWADFKLHHRPLLNEIAEQNKKDAVIRSILNEKNDLQEARGGFSEFIDDTGEILGSIASFGFADLYNNLQARDWKASAQQLRDRAQEIRKLPIDQIPEAMEEFHQHLLNAQTFLQTDEEPALRDLQTAFGTESDVRTADFWNLFEAVSFAGSLGAGKEVLKLLKSTRNTSRLATDAVSAMKKEASESNVYETAEEAVKDAMYLKTDEVVDSVAPAVQRELEINQRALEDVQRLANFDRLNNEELATAVKKEVNKLKKVYDRTPVQQGTARYNDQTGVYEMDILIGRKNGEPFANLSTAKTYLKKSGIEGEAVETDTGVFIKHTQTIAEQFADQGLKSLKPVNVLKRVFQAPRSFVDDVMGRMGAASAYNEARITGKVKDIYNRNIRALPSKEFEEVSTILNQGLADQKWYSPNELRTEFRKRLGKAPSEKQEQAYYAARQIEDFSHFVQNRAMYQDKAAKGMKTIELTFANVGEFSGQVFTEAADMTRVASNARIFDAGSNKFVRGTPAELDRLHKSGYVMVRPEDASWTHDALGEGVSFIATKSTKSLKVRDLDFNQLNYLPGGRVKYTDKFFIGQTRSGQYADGTRYQLAPYTFRSASTKIDAEEYAAKHNAAMAELNMLKQGKIPEDEASKLIEDLVGMTSREYEDFIEANRFNLNQPLKVRPDGKDFEPDYEMRDAVRMYSPEDIEAHFGTTPKGRLSRRGTERLLNVNEEDAATLDFVSAMNTSADQAIKMGAYNDFKISAVNRFNTEFRKYFDNVDDMSPYELATKGQLSDEFRKRQPELYNQVKAHQFYINNIMRVRGEWDERVAETIDQLAFFVEKGGDHGKKIAASIHQSSKDPVSKLRGINYDLNLGMFNPSQVLMQANSVLTAMSLSPKHALTAFKDIPFMRYMLIGNDDKLSQELAKRGADAAETGSDLIAATAQFKRLGLNDFGTNLAMMDMQNTLGATSNRFMSNVNRFRESGRFFFQEGERYGRLTAFNIARAKYKEANPGKNLFDKEADNWIRNEADRLLLSPNSDNNQLFTKGWSSLPTQFWSYMGKMSDAMLTGSGGRYSVEERIKLAGSQALFYGAGGIPLISWFTEQYQSTTGDILSAEQQKFLDNGLIDGTIYALSNGSVNTDFSASSGIGGFWYQMHQNLWENPLSTVAFGATGSNITGGMKAMAETAKMYSLWHNPTPEGVTAAGLAGIGSVVKSLSVVSKAALAYNAGVWQDRYGRDIASASKGEAIASLFGLRPQEVSSAYELLADNKDARTKYINEAATTLNNLHKKWYRAETDAERMHIEELISTFAYISQQSGYFPEVSKRVTSFKRQDNLYDSQLEQMMNRYINKQEGASINQLPLDDRRAIIEDMQ